MAKKYKTVDEYISEFKGESRKRLTQLRTLVRKTAPHAEERIGYNMPAYSLNGPLVYFAAYGNHTGFYATPTGHKAFAKELSAYKEGKGSVQFPHDEPLPVDLIKRIVEFRVEENLMKAAAKKTGSHRKKS